MRLVGYNQNPMLLVVYLKEPDGGHIRDPELKDSAEAGSFLLLEEGVNLPRKFF